MKLLDLLLPKVCFGCGDFVRDKGPLCGWCLGHAKLLMSPKCPKCAQPRTSQNGVDAVCATCLSEARWFDRVDAAFEYAGPITQPFLSAKFGKDPRQLAALSAWGAEILADKLEGQPFVAVPMRNKDLRRRGFSSVRIFARELQTRGLGDSINSVRKISSTHDLRRDRVTRKEMATQAFELREGVEIPEEVIVVDDVLTTGATMTAIARLLKRAGAKTVRGIVLARDA